MGCSPWHCKESERTERLRHLDFWRMVMFKMAGKDVRKIIWGADVKETVESSDYAFCDSKSILLHDFYQ